MPNCDCTLYLIFIEQILVMYLLQEARWPSGRASDSGARGVGSIPAQVAVLCP